jgi:hypothetical protein
MSSASVDIRTAVPCPPSKSRCCYPPGPVIAASTGRREALIAADADVVGLPFERRAIVAGVTSPLEALPAAVTARVETWARLEMRWHMRPIHPNYGKPVVSVEFESSAWLAEIMIWVTGEAELATVRLADDRIVNKRYELAGHGDLEVLLDELVGLLVDGRIPGAAVVAQWPGTTA